MWSLILVIFTLSLLVLNISISWTKLQVGHFEFYRKILNLWKFWLFDSPYPCDPKFPEMVRSTLYLKVFEFLVSQNFEQILKNSHKSGNLVWSKANIAVLFQSKTCFFTIYSNWANSFFLGGRGRNWFWHFMLIGLISIFLGGEKKCFEHFMTITLLDSWWHRKEEMSTVWQKNI